MSDNTNFGFAKLVPGFDFLQNLAKGASSMPQMPTLSSWVAPTLNVEELEKRISDLKAVHFWLDQNSKALGATIQALEVQRMTLATLQGMNVSMGEVANALKLKTTENMSDSMQKMAGAAGTMAGDMASSGTRRKAAEEPPKEAPAEKKTKTGNGAAGAPAVDPLQWWSSLTNQFQEIAANAMKDVAQTAAAMEPPGQGRKSAAAKAPAKAAKKTAARKRPPRKAA
jgi:hypothetical protein